MISWPANRIGEALEALARRSGLRPKSIELPVPPENLADDPRRLGLWIESATTSLGLEAAPEEVRYADGERTRPSTTISGRSPYWRVLPGVLSQYPTGLLCCVPRSDLGPVEEPEGTRGNGDAGDSTGGSDPTGCAQVPA